MRPTRVLAATALAAVLTLSACSSGGDDDASDAGGGAHASRADAEAVAPGDRAQPNQMEQANDELNVTQARDTEPSDPTDQAVIRKGNVQLRSDDVAKAAFDVQAVVDKYGGEITDTETGSDDEGEVRMARLVLRIPSDKFQEAFTKLEGVAERVSSTSTSEDVTDQMIDTSVRIRAQERSLSRVEVLLDRATSIRDIVAIESQLTRRQADLDSLQQRYAFLKDQTSMSTITVNIERTPEKRSETKEEDDDDLGFLSGLEGGFNALAAFAVGLATVVGALLPWTVVLVLVGGPLWLLLRRFRRRQLTPAPAVDPGDA